MQGEMCAKIKPINRFTSLIERWRKPLAIAVLVGQLAVPASLGLAKSPNKITNGKLEYVGFKDNKLLSNDLATSRKVAVLMKLNNANSAEVALPWSFPNQTDIETDKQRWRNALTAIDEQGLNLFLTFYFYKGKELGYPPLTASQISKYRYTINKYLEEIPSYAPNTKQIFLLPENEPNYEVFRNQINAKGSLVAPSQSALLLKQLYYGVKSDGLKLGVSIKVLGGSLSNNNPLEFIEGMSEAKDYLDGFAFHPYPGTLSVFDQSKLRQTVSAVFGPQIAIYNTEFGLETRGTSNLSVTEPAQAESYGRVVRSAACQELSSFILFQLIDTRDPGDIQSGIYRSDWTEKPAKKVVQQVYAEALTGTVKC